MVRGPLQLYACSHQAEILPEHPSSHQFPTYLSLPLPPLSRFVERLTLSSEQWHRVNEKSVIVNALNAQKAILESSIALTATPGCANYAGPSTNRTPTTGRDVMAWNMRRLSTGLT